MIGAANKAIAGAGAGALAAELAFPLSEIAAAAFVAWLPAMAGVEDQVAMAVRLVLGAAVGGVVYQTPNVERAA